MSRDLFPDEVLTFAASRADALLRLAAFIPRAGRYARDRNHVLAGHPNVSRLSPAIRHRLVTEQECAEAPLERYAPSTIDKFVQEIYWRRYWKAWLSLRPQVWKNYLADLEQLQQSGDHEATRARAERAQGGEGPIDIMNHFARELVETGYLHNHARMWFAGWWVHVERLPWQLGADFFFRHLLDADPASNTLSWRWVAGLQTPGKTYLPRRSNIEKYVDPAILDSHMGGLELLARPQAAPVPRVNRPEITQPSLPAEPALGAERVGLWIHEEDLLPEHGPLALLQPSAILATGDCDSWDRFRLPTQRQAWLCEALGDTASRATKHFQRGAELVTSRPLQETICEWAIRHGLRQVAALRPDVGPLADGLPALRAALAEHEVQLVLLDRPEDIALRPLATGGFFTFWKKREQLGVTA